MREAYQQMANGQHAAGWDSTPFLAPCARENQSIVSCQALLLHVQICIDTAVLLCTTEASLQQLMSGLL